MNKSTPAPWYVGKTLDGLPAIIGDGDSVVAYLPGAANWCTYKPDDARLIASAPDHAAIAWAVCSGIARWDSFRTSDGGEFCINGFRHATKLDEFGVPVMTGGMRAAITAATGEKV